MLRLVGLVVSLGLADSLNPSTVGPAIYLATGERPRRAVLRFTGTLTAVFFEYTELVAVMNRSLPFWPPKVRLDTISGR